MGSEAVLLSMQGQACAAEAGQRQAEAVKISCSDPAPGVPNVPRKKDPFTPFTEQRQKYAVVRPLNSLSLTANPGLKDDGRTLLRRQPSRRREPNRFPPHTDTPTTDTGPSAHSAVTALTLYVGGYFFVMHKRLQNPFISWPVRRPLPMVAYYRVNSLRIIYEPVVRLDQKLFPTRWVCPPTPKEQYEVLFKSIHFNRILEMSKPPNDRLQPTPR
jgi:hypothetical protein